MDTTQIDALLQAVEAADPADAPGLLEHLAEALEAELEDPDPEGSAS